MRCDGSRGISACVTLRASNGLIQTPFVKAQAIVDLISTYERPFRFQVTVFGVEAPYQQRRVYEIVAKTDALAAQEGMRRFTEEMHRRSLH